MLRWTVHLEGGPRRVNHAAVAVGHRVYSFGGYCSGEDYETLRQIDVHIFNAGKQTRGLSLGARIGEGSERWVPHIRERRGWLSEVQWWFPMAKEGGGNQRGWGTGGRPEGRLPGLSRAVPAVSLRWTKLPPVRPAARGQAPVVPYMRYGHSTVLIDDTVFLWGGRNDTEGACNVLYAFDVSEYGSQEWLCSARWCLRGPGKGVCRGGWE